MVVEGLLYTKDHEWAKVEGDVVTMGITDYAQEQLGDVIFMELPEPGTKIVRDDPFASIESAKAINDLVAPVNATVTRRNDDLLDEPEAINSDPYGDGWLIAVSRNSHISQTCESAMPSVAEIAWPAGSFSWSAPARAWPIACAGSSCSSHQVLARRCRSGSSAGSRSLRRARSRSANRW